MRVFATVLLSISLAASPLLAKDAKEAGTEETPAAVRPAVKPEKSAIENEVQDLRNLVEEQRAELESQRAALKALEEKFGATPTEPAVAPAVTSTAISSETPTPVIGATPRTLSASLSPQAEEKPSPLYFKIGAAEFYPLGFMDLMGVFRTTQLGGIGTNFGSIQFNNVATASAGPSGRLSEFRFSAQNSRIGLRTHAKFGEADVTGYLEADFLGYSVPNLNDTSNSDTLRMRLYWVDYKRGMWEFFGGQSWSFLTPNRNGLSALPGDLFYSQDVDTNYQLGLTWARQSSFRVIAHPTSNFAIGLAIENPQQTLPSSVVTPVANNTGYNSQFDTNSGNTSNANAVSNPNVANLHPDLILKAAFDAKPGGHQVHFDVAGLFRSFKAVNLVTLAGATTVNGSNANSLTNTIHGGGIAGTANVEVIKNLRVVATGFWSSGGGRYIGSTAAPDVIVKPNGTLSGVHSGSAIGGLEYQFNPNTILYGYYSGVYIGKNTGILTGGTVPTIGYGFPNSANSANRYLYEPTIGIHHFLWRNANYGDLRIMTQYSYVSRTPWAILAGQPNTAHMSMVYVDLRYDLP